MQNETNALTAEWQTLQNNIEAYERGALVIKLSATVLAVVLCLFDISVLLLIVVLLVLWLQEGIYRTSQVRLCERILTVELLISKGDNPGSAAFQLHTDWQRKRPGTLGLLSEYLSQSLRPTVAFPYPLLILISLLIASGAS
ncbi:MAG TPA: hypothetical protein VL381_00855 [Rhodocyclaceae bacterium]|jgi:hypothetical protein|nr:hypothetical protein [Rhodocyclaceae bacterium]